MSFLLDLFPLIIFFTAFKLTDIFIATGFLIVASFIQLIIFRVRDGKFVKSKVWLFLAILVFGGITIILHDDFYLKWKVTLMLSGFALAFLGSRFVGKRLLVKTLFTQVGEGLENVPESKWQTLNWIWVIAYSLQAMTNHYFAFYQSLSAWVDFKFYGLTGSTLVVMFISMYFIFPYLEDEEVRDSSKLKNKDSSSGE